jgi:hypothetical protein
MVTQVKEDEEQLEDFKKDHGDKDVNYGIIIALCQQITTIFAKDEELEDLIPIVVTLEFKEQGALPLWDEMMLVVIKELEATLV